MELLYVLIILAGMFIGMNIGANDAANCIGTSIGAGILNYKKGILIVSIMVLIGSTIGGTSTMKNIGKDVIKSDFIHVESLLIVLFCAGIIVFLFTLFGMPISTTQSILGSIAGLGLFLNGSVNWKKFFNIFFMNFVGFGIAIFFSFLLYIFISVLILKKEFVYMERILTYLVIFSATFSAYSLGANNIANAMGVVMSMDIISYFHAGLLGGLAIAIGSILFSKPVVKTISNEIASIDVLTALSAQISSASVLYILSIIGIPASITFTLVGSIIGVGLVKGIATVNKVTIVKIMLSWLFVPLTSTIFTLILLNILIYS